VRAMGDEQNKEDGRVRDSRERSERAKRVAEGEESKEGRGDGE
jgi:hypothetical protein